MEIAYVGPVPPLTGGISQHGARSTQALTDAGHTVHIHSWASQYPKLLYRGPAADHGARLRDDAHFELQWWDPRSWWRAGRSARRADLLVFPWVTPVTAPAYRTILAAASPTPAVAIVHNLRPHEPRPGDAALTRWVLARLKGALVHARSDVPLLESWAPQARVAWVPHPPNLEMSAEAPPPAPPHRLLFFGHVRPYKGLDVALEALRILLQRGVRVELTVAGHFWEPVDTWEKDIARSGLAAAVTLMPGYVPDPDAARLFAGHHVVIAPYRSATQSGIVPLALAARRPIVATQVGGLSETVTEGVTGALSPPDDPNAFADAVERALAIPVPLSPESNVVVASWAKVAECIVELGR